ncbi:hypothetical protein HUU59_11975 [bacterium]|nr:hypothetical protein [bacterium]
MTAEIAILNKRGVVLAADSAATFSTTGATKIKPTAEKIFALSATRPIGVMIFGSAEFIGFPWDLLIKSYRDEDLKQRTFGTLEEYSSDFQRYLASRTDLFSNDVQQNYIMTVFYNCFVSLIKTLVEPGIKRTIRNKGRATPRDVRAVLSAAIERSKLDFGKKSYRAGYNKRIERQLEASLSAEIDKTISAAFAKLPLSQVDQKNLRKIATMAVTRESLFPENYSGIVFAGYGEAEYFPHLVYQRFFGIFQNGLRIQEIAKREVTLESGALVVPFAQGDMISTVMEGVDPGYQKAIENDIGSVIDIIVGETIAHVDGIAGLAPNQKQLTNDFATDLGKKAKSAFSGKLEEYRRKNFVSPIVSIVKSLDKADLAEMALTLVNLTSFKRRVSTDEETVGGPVDVAIISKNDGFVWKERKLYFDSSLNPRHMARY